MGGEGVPGETLGGEIKDISQVSSADVDGRRPANRNKWDCFDRNLTCFRKPSTVLQSLFFLSFSTWRLFPMLKSPPTWLTRQMEDPLRYTTITVP